MMVVFRKTLLAAALIFGLSVGGVAAGNEIAPKFPVASVVKQTVVVIGDDSSAAAENSWLARFAAQTGAEVVNALRADWRTAETWYVREVLQSYPRADAYVFLPAATELAAMTQFDPEALARIAARVGYMIDLARQANPSADVLVVAPAATDENLGAMSAEVLALDLEKIAAEHRAKSVSFPRHLPSGYRRAADAQQQIAQLVAGELSAPLIANRQPLAAELGVIAPPAAGRPLVDSDSVAALVGEIAKNFDTPAKENPAERSAPPFADATTSAARSIQRFVSDRDVAKLLSEEGVELAGGVAEAIGDAVYQELALQQDARMETLFNETGAAEFAQVDFQPPFVEGEISAIVPPRQAEHTFAEVVDWQKDAGLNQVKLANAAGLAKIPAPAVAAEPQDLYRVKLENVNEAVLAKIPALSLEEFAGDADVPGMVQFDAAPRNVETRNVETRRAETLRAESNAVVANAAPVKPVTPTEPAVLAEAPATAPNTLIATPVVANAAPVKTASSINLGADALPLPEVEFAEAGNSQLKVEDFYNGATMAMRQAENGETVASIVMPATSIITAVTTPATFAATSASGVYAGRGVTLTEEAHIAQAATDAAATAKLLTRNAPYLEADFTPLAQNSVNDERFMEPYHEPLFDLPRYGVYIHTAIE
ncbi:MAG: hypothetical protein LBP75_10525 [Planctomycetota bacterium]|jgi:hypothetical protein|nr:hypothetical protein [Planctomycetota bacterium]